MNDPQRDKATMIAFHDLMFSQCRPPLRGGQARPGWSPGRWVDRYA